MSRIVRIALLALTGLVAAAPVAIAPTVAQAAAPAPYTDWVFDLKRAVDDAGTAELTRRAPHFARVWFYGQVFDLVTVGVSEEVRATLRPKLETIARTLSESLPPDPTPSLMLDRARVGTLEALSKSSRQLEDDLVQSARGGDSEAANFSAASHPDLARIVFFRILARAESTRLRLGGVREASLLADLGRRVAEGYGLAIDDLSLWATVAAWQGGAGVSVGKELVVDQQVAAGLNAALLGDMPGARRSLETALATARATRGNTFYTALILNGTANMAARGGDARGAQAIRHQVLLQIRPMNDPTLLALLADRLIRTYIVEKNWTEVTIYTRELRALGPAVTQAPDYLASLETAATALKTAADAEVAAARLHSAVPLLKEAALIMGLLVPREVVAVTVPTDQVEAARILRERAAAEIHRSLARIEERRAKYAEARAGFDQARVTFDAVGAIDGLGSTELDLSRVELSAGNLDEAQSWANQAITHLESSDFGLLAKAYGQRGWLRLRRGEFAAAFENANAGLTVLKATGEPAKFVVERAALHRLAAVALDASGYTAQARDRLAFGRKVHPSADTVLLSAQLAFEAGDLAGVGQAFDKVPEAVVDSRVRLVYQGCTAARLGNADAALATLSKVTSLVAQSLRPYQAAGRTCLARARLLKGDAAGALNDVLPAKALAIELSDASLSWRVAVLEGDALMAQGKTSDAAASWRQAADFYVQTLMERPDLGATLDTRLPALPADPSAALARLPHALADAAAATKGDESAANQTAAVLYAELWHQLRIAPTDAASALVDRRPAGEAGVRSALAAVNAVGDTLIDPAIEGPERGPAVVAAAAAAKRLKDARQAALDEAPAYWGWLAPQAPAVESLKPEATEARLFYYTGEDAGRVWLWLPGDAAPRGWKLPGRAALGALLAPALAATLHAPLAWPPKSRPGSRDPNVKDWEALSKPVAVLLPFLKDRALEKRLAGKSLRIYADGPLLRFPLEALVVGKAPRGAARSPVALASKFSVTRGLLPGLKAAARTGEPAKLWATVGPVVGASACPAVAGGAAAGTYDPCAGADAALEAERLAGLFAGIPDKATSAAGPMASAGALGAALDQGKVAHLMTPLAVETGDLSVSGLADGPAEAITPRVLALSPTHAETALFTRLSAPSLDKESGDGLRRLAAALRFAGVPQLALLAYRNGAEGDVTALTQLAAEVAAGSAFADAIAARRKGSLAAVVDPKAGGVPADHPWGWSRWLVLSR